VTAGANQHGQERAMARAAGRGVRGATDARFIALPSKKVYDEILVQCLWLIRQNKLLILYVALTFQGSYGNCCYLCWPC
jgi:hypothetical protein